MTDLGTARGKIEIDASGAEAGFKKAERAADTTFNKLEASSGTMLKVGGALAGVGAGLAAGIGLAIKASADFEAELSNFKAVTGATTQEMEKLRQKSLQIGRDTSIGAGEAAQAMVELGKAGLETSEILAGAADATVALAEAGELELARAAEITTATMAQFNLTAEDSGRIADLLAGTANAAQGSVEDLGMALRNVGPMAGTLGVTLEDTTTALGLLAANGLTGAKGGTALMATLRQLNPQSAVARKELQELGIITEDGGNRFFDAAGNMKSLADVSQILQDSISGLTREQTQLALATIFGTEGLAGAVNLARAGTSGFNEMAGAISEISAAEVAAERLNNLSGAITILKGTIETALIASGAPFQDALKGIVENITSLINAFASMDPKIQQFIVFAAAALGGVLLLAGGFLLTVGTLIKAVAAFRDFIPVVRLLGTVVKGLFATLSAHPFVLIAAAVVALAYVIYRNWDSIVAFVKSAWEKIKNFFSGAGDFFSNVFNRAKEAIVNAVQSIIGWLKDNWKTLLIGVLTGPFGLLVLFITQNWDRIKAVFLAGVEAVVNFFAELPSKIAFTLGLVIGTLIRWGLEFVAKAQETARNFVEAIINFFRTLPEKVALFLLRLIARAIIWHQEFVNWARKAGAEFVENLIEFFRTLPERAVLFLVQLINRIINFAGEARSAAIRIGTGIFNGIQDFIRDLPNMVTRVFVRAINAIYDFVGRARRAAQDVASNLWSGFKAGLGISSPSFIEEAMFAITRTMDEEVNKLNSSIGQVQKASASLTSDQNIRAMVDVPTRSLATAGVGSTHNESRVDDHSLNIEKLEYINPKEETLEESLPRMIRKVNWVRQR